VFSDQTLPGVSKVAICKETKENLNTSMVDVQIFKVSAQTDRFSSERAANHGYSPKF
jgi:hypothetical protein